jgi:predicted ABC-type ATPase
MHNALEEQKIVIIAGPNGAGKTTFAREFLPNEAHCPTFINADLIAAGISPFAAESVAVRAGRLMLTEIENQVQNRKSFAFETTLSGRAYLHKIREWQIMGYHVKLVYLSLPSADLAVARVAARVAQGGHNIPEDVIRRRFSQGLHNFNKLYQSIVDAWILYDNSGRIPRLLSWGEKT